MGGGASVPKEQAVRQVLPEMSLSSLLAAAEGKTGPLLLTGQVALRKNISPLRSPLGTELVVYHRSCCEELVKGNYKRRIFDEKFLDFDLVDNIDNPQVRISVPFQHLQSHFLLKCVQNDMSHVNKPDSLTEPQKKFLRNNKFEATSYALIGMNMKKLLFTESSIRVGQTISIICSVHEKWAGPVKDHKSFTQGWPEKTKNMWKSLFGKPAIVVTDDWQTAPIPTVPLGCFTPAVIPTISTIPTISPSQYQHPSVPASFVVQPM